MFYLVFKNLLIFSEGEHLHREALDVGWDGNLAVTRYRMEDRCIAIAVILTACEVVNS